MTGFMMGLHGDRMMSEQIICPLCGQPSGGTETMGNEVCINPNCLVEIFRIRTIKDQWEYTTLKKVTQPTEGKPSVWKVFKNLLPVALLFLSLSSLTALLQGVREDKAKALIKMDCGASCEHEITALEILEGKVIEKLLDGEKW